MELTQLCRLSAFQLAEMVSIRVQWNHESHHYSHFIYQSCKAVTLLCPLCPQGKNGNILNSMWVLHCLNRREGGNTILYILSLLLSITGSTRVQWNPECHHYSHFIYQPCKANGMLSRQEGSRRNSTWWNWMFVLQPFKCVLWEIDILFCSSYDRHHCNFWFCETYLRILHTYFWNKRVIS